MCCLELMTSFLCFSTVLIFKMLGSVLVNGASQQGGLFWASVVEFGSLFVGPGCYSMEGWWGSLLFLVSSSSFSCLPSQEWKTGIGSSHICLHSYQFTGNCPVLVVCGGIPLVSFKFVLSLFADLGGLPGLS